MPRVITEPGGTAEPARLRGEVGALAKTGARGLLDRGGPVARLARSRGVLQAMAEILGPSVRPVRAFALAKSAANNWLVP